MSATIWNLWATRSREDNFWHIGAKRWVELHGLDDPIVPVTVEILAEGRHEDDAYYGWQDAGEYDKPPGMIFPRWQLFSMCFTYGPQVEVARGRGRILKLSVTAREEPAGKKGETSC
jgi:hypothetical protein